MEPVEFINALRQVVIAETGVHYETSLNDTRAATDPTWKNFKSIYASLNAAQQKAVLAFIRLVQVDTVSSMLGVLDGSSYLSDHDEQFTLTTSQGEELNGDLQEIFLEIEERNEDDDNN